MCVCVHAYHLCTGPMVVRRACSILRRWSYRWLQAFWRGCWKPNSGPGRAIHTLDHWAISSDSSINLKKKNYLCVCMHVGAFVWRSEDNLGPGSLVHCCCVNWANWPVDFCGFSCHCLPLAIWNSVHSTFCEWVLGIHPKFFMLILQPPVNILNPTNFSKSTRHHI